MTLEQIQKNMSKLVLDAYNLGLQDGSEGTKKGKDSPTPESIEEVKEFILKEYPAVTSLAHETAFNWYNYYDTRDFVLPSGKQMKKWRPCVRLWISRDARCQELLRRSQYPQQQSQQPQRNINY